MILIFYNIFAEIASEICVFLKFFLKYFAVLLLQQDARQYALPECEVRYAGNIRFGNYFTFTQNVISKGINGFSDALSLLDRCRNFSGQFCFYLDLRYAIFRNDARKWIGFHMA
jgi:hypothetical protein